MSTAKSMDTPKQGSLCVYGAAIIHETNTMSPIPTGLRDWMIHRSGDAKPPYELAVMADAAVAKGHDFTWSTYARAEPSGLVTRSTYETLRDEILDGLAAAQPVDMVVLALHGAMVADGYDDCEGDLLRRVRDAVGPAVVVGASIDLHAHATARMIEAADVIVGYKEYPHTDINHTTRRVYELCTAQADGEIRPVSVLVDCNMVGMYFTRLEPMRSFVERVSAVEAAEGVLAVTVVHGFPWADVVHRGTKVLVVADGDEALARTTADQVADALYERRHELQPMVESLDEALDHALRSAARPVVVADQADNAGGGAPSDSTFVLEALLGRQVDSACLALMYDPGVVAIAKSAGLGAEVDVRLGGKLGPTSGVPLDLRVEIIGMAADVTQGWPQDDGVIEMPIGDVVGLRCGGIDIAVNNIRSQVFSPDVFTCVGIHPSRHDVVVVKSTQHFRAGFEALAGEIIHLAGPGAITPRIEEISYQVAPTDCFPWVDRLSRLSGTGASVRGVRPA